MASRRSPFPDAAEAPGLYYGDQGYLYPVPQTQFRTMSTAPMHLAEDRQGQIYPAPVAPAASTYIISTCCRNGHSRRRRASRYFRAYDSDASTESYVSYEENQPARQEVDRLPPRIALKQLSDYLYHTVIFYETQLVNFAREHQRSGHDSSNEALRQWLWNDWVNRRDSATRDSFTSTKTSVTQMLHQVELSVATPWLEDTELVARFDFSIKTLKAMCGEIVRLAGKAATDWRACRFLVVELKNARDYACPTGPIQHPLFVGWDKEQVL